MASIKYNHMDDEPSTTTSFDSKRSEAKERSSSATKSSRSLSPRSKSSTSRKKESVRFPENRPRSPKKTTSTKAKNIDALTIEDIGWGNDPLTIEDIGWSRNVEASPKQKEQQRKLRRRSPEHRHKMSGRTTSSRNLRRTIAFHNDAPLQQQQQQPIQRSTRALRHKSFRSPREQSSTSSRNLMSGTTAVGGNDRISRRQRMRRAVSLRDNMTKDRDTTSKKPSKTTQPKEDQEETVGASYSTEQQHFHQPFLHGSTTTSSSTSSKTKKKMLPPGPRIVLPCTVRTLLKRGDAKPKQKEETNKVVWLDSCPTAHSDLASLEFGLDGAMPVMNPSSQLLRTWAPSSA